MTSSNIGGLSNLEYHVLLALANGPVYGYAIADAVGTESDGTLTPRAGSLYRFNSFWVSLCAIIFAPSANREASPM